MEESKRPTYINERLKFIVSKATVASQIGEKFGTESVEKATPPVADSAERHCQR
jgi:hypothetical protein